MSIIDTHQSGSSYYNRLFKCLNRFELCESPIIFNNFYLLPLPELLMELRERDSRKYNWLIAVCENVCATISKI